MRDLLYSVLQCVAVCCSMLQSDAVFCSLLQSVAVFCSQLHNHGGFLEQDGCVLSFCYGCLFLLWVSLV